MYHKKAIENYPLQGYLSALIFSPAQSLIRRHFVHEEPKWIKIRPSMKEWPACLQTLEGHGSLVNSVAFSHDSSRLASASADETVKIWDASSGACVQTLEGHGDSVWSVAFSHDSSRLASASSDKTVKIWDASSGACLQSLEVGKVLYDISFDVTSSYLHSDIGTIDIGTSSPLCMLPAVIEPQSLVFHGVALSIDSAWIMYNSMKLIRLPSEEQLSCSIVSANTLGIGFRSGRVYMCRFDVDNR